MAYLVAAKRGKHRFVWVDRWTRWVAIQTGTVGHKATPTLIELDDEDAASERLEREIRRARNADFAPAELPKEPSLVSDGDALLYFGLGEPGPVQRGFAMPRAVTDAIRTDPDDETAWAHLEGWIREHVPVLRQLLDTTRIDPTQLTPEQATLLFGGPKWQGASAITGSTWRAAHIVECSLTYRGNSNVAAAFAACGDAPAFAFLRSLDARVLGGSTVNNLNSLAPRLHRLALRVDGSRSKLPDHWFARCKRLRSLRLEIEGPVFNPVDVFDRIETLELVKCPADLWSCRFPNVTSLMVDVRQLGANAEALAATLTAVGAAMPAVTTLRPFVLAGWNRDSQSAVLLDVIAGHSLLPRLRQVILESSEERAAVDTERRRTWRGGAFARLEHLELAAINARLMA